MNIYKEISKLIIVFSFFCLAFFVNSAEALSQSPSKDDLFKAASIYGFYNYVEVQGGERLDEICIVGNENVYNRLLHLSSSRESEVKITFFKTADSKIKLCDIVFISSQNASVSAKAIGIIAGAQKPILSASDLAGFISNNGGIVEFYEDKGRVRYDINLKKSLSENLVINSKMVESAVNIY